MQRAKHSQTLLVVSLWSALVFGSLILLSQGKSFFIPLVTAMIAVYLILAVSRVIRAIPKIGKLIPGPVALILSFITIFFFGYVLFAIVADNARTVAQEIPRYQAKLDQLQAHLFQKFHIQQTASIRDILQSLDLRGIFTAVASGLGSLLANLTLIFIYTLFLLLEVRFINSKIEALLPNPEQRKIVMQIIDRIDKDIQTYLGVKTLVSIITGLLSYGIMRLVKLDFAEFWALLIFVLNYIPTIGSIFSTLFPSLLAIVQFESLPPMLVVIVGIICVQQLMGSIIEPNIMGESLNLSPLVVVISLILWGHLWGVVGMFLCVPITVILVIILSNFEKTRWVAVLLSKDGTLRVHVKLPGSQ
ncbi:MAG: AI-2E family transporter [Chthoniobacterales bacterium]|nr:AI-2E family transporter [Chthoniobacterales bacterium]